MTYQVNKPIQVSIDGNSTNYLCSPKHRGKATAEISIWTVSIDEELACFTNCFQNSWHGDSKGWGFIGAGVRELTRIGQNLRNSHLLIAKFVEDQNQWHGYPADVRHKPADKPIPSILLAWFQNGFISKSLMVRIKQGQL